MRGESCYCRLGETGTGCSNASASRSASVQRSTLLVHCDSSKWRRRALPTLALVQSHITRLSMRLSRGKFTDRCPAVVQIDLRSASSAIHTVAFKGRHPIHSRENRSPFGRPPLRLDRRGRPYHLHLRIGPIRPSARGARADATVKAEGAEANFFCREMSLDPGKANETPFFCEQTAHRYKLSGDGSSTA